jgi:hypothetical protein
MVDYYRYRSIFDLVYTVVQGLHNCYQFDDETKCVVGAAPMVNFFFDFFEDLMSNPSSFVYIYGKSTSEC